MSVLGIYFGSQVISLVETEDKKVINNIQIFPQQFSGADPETKVPDEKKIAAAIQDELRKNNILVREAGIVLMGKDLIIRTFHLPMLPASELYDAIRFEAKKYIPFRVEEMVSDFQLQIDRANRKTFVLFVGVKKDILQKYVYVLNELNIKITSIEYAGFSILRLLKLAKIKEKAVSAVMIIDLAEADEANFIVLENGFPLFSRDIMSSAELPQVLVSDKDAKFSEDLEKLKVELRISQDFYLRKFPTKNIKEAIFICGDEYRPDLEAFIKERGLSAQFIEAKKLIDNSVAFSLSFFKAYAAALAKSVKTGVKINLLTNQTKTKAQIEEAAAGSGVLSFLGLVKINVKIALIGLLIILFPLLVDFYLRKPVEGQLAQVTATRPSVTSVNPAAASLEELAGVASGYKEKIRNINSVLKERIFVTVLLEAISHALPNGVWLNEFSFSKDRPNTQVLNLQGLAYLKDSSRERQTVNKFLIDLKENPGIKNNFKNIRIISLDPAKFENMDYTSFLIVCRSQ
jgi:hypothetical protein